MIETRGQFKQTKRKLVHSVDPPEDYSEPLFVKEEEGFLLTVCAL